MPPDNKASGVDLRLLNALANVLVREREVVAVACRRERGGVVQFVACVDYGLTPAQPSYRSDQDAASRDSEIFTWFAATNTPNPRKEERPSTTPNPCNPTMSLATTKERIRSLDELAHYLVKR